MLFLAYLLQGAGFGLAAAAQPGPFMAYLIGQTLAHGWRRTLPAALAPLISDGPIIALMLLVLTRLPDSFRVALYLAGGVFILYLAHGAYRNWRQYAENGVEDRDSPTTGGVSAPGSRSSVSEGRQPGAETRPERSRGGTERSHPSTAPRFAQPALAPPRGPGDAGLFSEQGARRSVLHA
ncbi:MAG: hypothetical protein N2204_07660, partial [Anaerolineae bacterium]|nr:hypothetical protein [Anaerolineae bacterium]